MKRYYIYPVEFDGKTTLEIYGGPESRFKQKEVMVKVQGEKLWSSDNFGKTWDEVKMNASDVGTAPEKREETILPDEPIDVASMLINATITVEPGNFGSLSSLPDKEPQIFAKYDTNQLLEIAEHLLVYCEAQERGFKDACCENCEP